MFGELLTKKFKRLIELDLVLDERLAYECHLPTKGKSGKHAVLRWDRETQEWRAIFTSSAASLYLTEAQAVAYLEGFKELNGGQVLKVACSCHRCACADFQALANQFTISHGACDAHVQDMLRMVRELKEAA